MTQTTDPQVIYRSGGTAGMAYTHCKTRIISLIDLKIPEVATEAEYKKIYGDISRSKSSSARTLADAVSSVSLGIAPPVAFPTETVYGLGADATNRASIAGIFAAKGRPSDNPLIVHVASVQHLEQLIGEPIPTVYTELVKEHWPGPLTILVPIPQGNSVFAPNVHPGQGTIGFRIPESKYARFFIAATGKPIAGPSANSSGKPSPTTAQHVLDDLNGKINFILDGGSCNVGVESTVVDGLHDPPLILRPGGLSQDDLIAHGRKHNNVWANVAIGYKQTHENHDAKTINGVTTPEEAPRAPGMKYKHYAPQGRMILIEGSNSQLKVQTELDALIDAVASETALNGPTTPPQADSSSSEPLNIAILTSTSWPIHAGLPTTTTSETTPNQPQVSSAFYRAHKLHSINLGRTPRQIAQNLFAALRTCDDLKCRFIIAEAPVRELVHVVNGDRGSTGEGWDVEEEELLHRFDAVLERMRKAASLVVG